MVSLTSMDSTRFASFTVRELTRYGETIVLAQMHKPAHASDA